MNNPARYWDKPWSLVDGCTPCSPGCDHCWSASMTHRFNFQWTKDGKPEFNGHITVRPERLDIPLKRKKPTVYAIWNDLFHEDVYDCFITDVFHFIDLCRDHTFLILTKRPQIMLSHVKRSRMDSDDYPHIYWGLTVCNQQEADKKIPIFLQVPGKKFLSIEPCLSNIIFGYWRSPSGDNHKRDSLPGDVWFNYLKELDVVILGGETGPGARPMHPDWVRSVRDQCAAVGVPFFFKQWGEWHPNCLCKTKKPHPVIARPYPGNRGVMFHCGKKAGRLLDGRTHDDLPWRKDGR